MKLSDIAKLRMYNQRIVGDKFSKPEEVVKHLGAVQAQDYLGALWAVGLRMNSATEADVESSLAKRKIIRTWPMRGTLHFVHIEDARWMLDLLAPRVIRAVTLRSEQRFGLNEKIIEHCKELLRKALHGGNKLSRPEIYHVFEEGGVSTKNSRGLHILGRLALDKLICFGPREGKQKVFVLFDYWVPKSKKLEREEALTKLAVRYFTSHGPAQIQDLAWWSGLSAKDVRQGIELAGTKLIKEEVEGKTYWMGPEQPMIKENKTAYLLPPFDEFLVAYRDRTASLETVHAQHVNPGANGMFSPVIVINGQVLGIWKRTIKKGSVFIYSKPFTKFDPAQIRSIEKAEAPYRKFICEDVSKVG